MGAEQIFNVDLGLLRAHAGTVEALADDLAAARSTVGVGMDPQAYGWLCAFLAPVVGDTSERGAEALAATTRALTETARTLDGAGASFAGSDSAGAPAASAEVDSSLPMLNGPVHD